MAYVNPYLGRPFKNTLTSVTVTRMVRDYWWPTGPSISLSATTDGSLNGSRAEDVPSEWDEAVESAAK